MIYLSDGIFMLLIIKSERKRSAKIWLDTLEVFEQGKLTKQEINIAVNVLEENREKVIAAIQNFAQGKKIKTLQL